MMASEIPSRGLCHRGAEHGLIRTGLRMMFRHASRRAPDTCRAERARSRPSDACTMCECHRVDARAGPGGIERPFSHVAAPASVRGDTCAEPAACANRNTPRRARRPPRRSRCAAGEGEREFERAAEALNRKHLIGHLRPSQSKRRAACITTDSAVTAVVAPVPRFPSWDLRIFPTM